MTRTPPTDHGGVPERELLTAVRRSLDLEKTQMQQTGKVETFYLTLSECMEIVSDLGIDPSTVRFFGDGFMRVWDEKS